MLQRSVCLCAGLALAGCVSSGGGDTIRPLPSNISSSAFVSEIVLKDAPPNVSAGFPATFQTKVAERLAACAKGKTPLRLEVSISDFHAENGAVTILAGSSNRIKGAARLIDPTTGAVVGDFDIT